VAVLYKRGNPVDAMARLEEYCTPVDEMARLGLHCGCAVVGEEGVARI